MKKDRRKKATVYNPKGQKQLVKKKVKPVYCLKLQFKVVRMV